MTNIPHWERVYLWRIADIKFELAQIYAVKQLIKKHPELDDPIGNKLREMLKIIDKKLIHEKNKYKKIYGEYPKTRTLRKEAENAL